MKSRLFDTLTLGLLTIFLMSCQPKDPLNILYIMSDDHAYQAISAYGHGLNKTPNIDRLAEEGIRFENAFVTNSICAPSRAVVLTGKFSHVNGHLDNGSTFDGSQVTVPKLLQQAGYQTAMVGKWHLKSDPTGFDFWRVLLGQGPYYNPDLKDSTGVKRVEGYTTTVITDVALDWLDKRDNEKPFFLMVHHKAPHRSWMPEPKYFDFEKNTYPIPDTYFDDYSNRGRAAKEQKMSVIEDMLYGWDLKIIHPDSTQRPRDANWLLGQLGRMNSEQRAAWDAHYSPIIEDYLNSNREGKELAIWKFQRYMRDYLACIQSVDDQVGRLLAYLDQNGLAEKTAVIYTSDQGFYLGEHGWFDKRFMYEESLGTPLLMKIPGMASGGQVSQALVQNLDFAETFLDLAGATIPDEMQGLSLVNPYKQAAKDGGTPDNWRNSVYYHYYEYPGAHAVKRHYGVRTDRYKLIHFYHDVDEWELFDLEKDPKELMNVINDPAYTEVLVDMKAELKKLQEEYGDSYEEAKELIVK